MTVKRTRRRVVEEGINWGVYAWKMHDGKFLGDKDGNMLNIPAIRGDIRAMSAISRFVKDELKIDGGGPIFLEGVQPLTQAEHDGQMEQLLDGKTPDLDVAAAIDSARKANRHGNQRD